MERALRLALGRRRAIRGAMAAVVAVVALTGVTPAAAQSGARRPDSGRVESQSDGDTQQSRYVTIPFTVGPEGCEDRRRTYVVTMRIYNVLAQPVGIPTLASVSPAGHAVPESGRLLNRVALPCGQYIAVWNGRHIVTRLRMAPGVYVYDLVIDGQRITRKVTLGR